MEIRVLRAVRSREGLPHGWRCAAWRNPYGTRHREDL